MFQSILLYVCKSWLHSEARRVSDPLELVLWAAIQVQGLELGSSAKGASVLTCWATTQSLATFIVFNNGSKAQECNSAWVLGTDPGQEHSKKQISALSRLPF